MLFEVSAEGYHHLRTASFRQGLQQDGDHSKLSSRLKALKGCSLVFVADVGPDGERGLARHRVAPLRQFAGHPIALALDALRDGLRNNPTRWLRHEEQRQRRQGHSPAHNTPHSEAVAAALHQSPRPKEGG